MTNAPWSGLFPSKLSLIIFVLYILLFVNQGITFLIFSYQCFTIANNFLQFVGLLVTASQESNKKYNYNVVTVVLMTEALKLIISISLYCKE